MPSLRRISRLAAVPAMALAAFFFQMPAGPAAAQPGPTVPADPPNLFNSVPLCFEQNLGQTDARVLFMKRGPGYEVFLTRHEATLLFHRPGRAAGEADVLNLKFAGSDRGVEVQGAGFLEGTTNFIDGRDPARWSVRVPHFGRVRYENLYPAIDLTFYGRTRWIAWDFMVRPGGDPAAIRLSFEGAEAVEVSDSGSLWIRTAGGDLSLRAPRVYQEFGQIYQDVAGRWVSLGNRRIGIEVGAFDRSLPLEIDASIDPYSGPGVEATTEIHHVAVDPRGRIYVAGHTQYSLDYPLQPGPFRQACEGAGNRLCQSDFVARLSPCGADFDYLTYLFGGVRGHGTIMDLEVAADGGAYILGSTDWQGLPTSAGALFPEDSAWTKFRRSRDYVVLLSPEGDAIDRATWLFPSGASATLLALGPDGGVYLAGRIQGEDAPRATPGALQTVRHGRDDAFVARLSSDLSALDHLTYLSWSGEHEDWVDGLEVDALGNVWLLGGYVSDNGSLVNTFLAKLSPDGARLGFRTALFETPGPDNFARLLAVDRMGGAYVAANGDAAPMRWEPTPGALYPVPASSCAAMIARLDAEGALRYLTYFPEPVITSGAVGADDHLLLAGSTRGAGSNGEPASSAEMPDVFFGELGGAGDTLYRLTHWGSPSSEYMPLVAVCSSGEVFLAGSADGGAVCMDPPCCTHINYSFGTAFVVRYSAEANTPPGEKIALAPTRGVELTFGEVLAAGRTAAARTTSGPEIPEGFSLGVPGAYYEIATTAAFAGPITICIAYAGTEWGVESGLGLYQHEGGTWRDVTVRPVDTTENVICGRTPTLSAFAVMRPPAPPLQPQGFLAPLAQLVPEGGVPSWPETAFRAGRTLPLRMRLLAEGTELAEDEVSSPPRIVAFDRREAPGGSPEVLEFGTKAPGDRDDLFRYEASEWVHRLDTTGLEPGDYVLIVQLPDGGRFVSGLRLR